MMPNELTNTSEVMAALGGVRAVAALTNRKPGAAWNWTKSPTFPSATYFVMQTELARLGHSAPPSLWGMAGTAQFNEQASDGAANSNG